MKEKKEGEKLGDMAVARTRIPPFALLVVISVLLRSVCSFLTFGNRALPSRQKLSMSTTSAPTTTAVAVLPSIFSEEKAEFLTSDNVKMQILQLGAALDRGQVYNPTSGEQYKQNMDMARNKIELLISKRRPNSLRFQAMEGEWELVLSTVPHGIVSI